MQMLGKADKIISTKDDTIIVDGKGEMKISITPMIEKFNQLEIKIRYGVFIVILLVIFLVDLFTIIGFQWGALQNIGNENQIRS